MNFEFACVGLVGLPRHADAMETHRVLYQWLIAQGYCVIVEDAVAEKLQLTGARTASLEDIGMSVDLGVVVGGDGNMLRAAKAFVKHHVKLIGINRGTLGFLTDIAPEEAVEQLQAVLNGDYISDPRSLLEVQVRRDEEVLYSAKAVNEIILHPDKVAHMIEFSVEINRKPTFSQRADGLIIATPTGSTAYSLSAGGPILEPHLDAIVIVPMFPHVLTARPLVVAGSSLIHIRHFSHNESDLEITCDSQISLPVKYGNNILVKQSDDKLNLIHPTQYNYFCTLSSKLGWLR